MHLKVLKMLKMDKNTKLNPLFLSIHNRPIIKFITTTTLIIINNLIINEVTQTKMTNMRNSLYVNIIF